MAPGDQVTVVGQSWGDNCYDTGPPPEGQGVLGVPAEDIEIVFVQGSDQTVVARGAADDDYGFAVEITVPPAAVPGTAWLRASATGAPYPGPLSSEPLILVTASDDPSAEVEVATFGEGELVEDPPEPTETTAVPDSSVDAIPVESDALLAPDRTGRNVAVGLALLAGIGAAVTAGVFLRRRRLAR